ncbi:S-layer homology domain-containing protein [Syntrophomonas palmitatica]|uniref:S-layer homology domain-containing protein n=1 Tax=Syntrophomonas palmitatica TaxID=402877 RepID=UPI0006D251C1|nr:S-layer homology domain-containing protein [Syntrophomonas palmitatica]
MEPGLKNQAKPLICVLIVFFLMLSTSSAKGAQFTDLTGHWSASNVYESKTLDLLSGYPDGSFKPEQYITKLESLVIFMRAAGYNLDGINNAKNKKTSLPANAVMPDVPWGKAYLERALEDKILTPNELATYSYNAPASRAEIAVLIGRLFMLSLPDVAQTGSETSFRDVGQVSPDILPYIYAVSQAGLMSGYGDGSFRPGNSLKRSEGATLLAQLIEKQWLKSASDRVLEGWIRKHTKIKNKAEIELVSAQGVQKLKLAQDLKCFKDGNECPVEQALYWKARVLTDSKKAAACIVLLDKKTVKTDEQTIRGTIKSIAVGEDSYVIINDLDAHEQKIPVDWGMEIESSSKTGEKGLKNLKAGTFVELHLTDQKATRLVVLDVKNTSGMVERIDSLYLYLKSSGSGSSKSKVPNSFMNYSRAGQLIKMVKPPQ